MLILLNLLLALTIPKYRSGQSSCPMTQAVRQWQSLSTGLTSCPLYQQNALVDSISRNTRNPFAPAPPVHEKWLVYRFLNPYLMHVYVPFFFLFNKLDNFVVLVPFVPFVAISQSCYGNCLASLFPVLFSYQTGIEAYFTARKNTLVTVPGDTSLFVSGWCTRALLHLRLLGYKMNLCFQVFNRPLSPGPLH